MPNAAACEVSVGETDKVGFMVGRLIASASSPIESSMAAANSSGGSIRKLSAVPSNAAAEPGLSVRSVESDQPAVWHQAATTNNAGPIAIGQ